jgi:protein TonB
VFDNVGQDLDKERHKRQLVAVLITVGICSLISGSVVLYGILMVAEKVLQVQQDEDMVEVVVDEPVLEAPPPPPPPPPPPSAAPEPEEEEEEPDPEEMQEEIKELDKEVEEEVKNDAQAASSDPAGVVGGQLGGVAGGVVGGVEGGVVGGQLGGVRTFHHSELQVKRRVVPEYPEAAREMNLGDQDCKVRIFIDEEGVPYDVKFEACPKVFHDSARDAILKWRWYPAKVGGEKVKAQFLLNVKYKLTG